MTPELASPPGGEPRLSDEELATLDWMRLPAPKAAVELRALRADLKKAEAERDHAQVTVADLMEGRVRAESRAEALRSAAAAAAEYIEALPTPLGASAMRAAILKGLRVGLKDGQP